MMINSEMSLPRDLFVRHAFLSREYEFSTSRITMKLSLWPLEARLYLS